MTINYTSQVESCKGFGSFWRLLFRWRGSVYKLIWPDLLLYSFGYFLLSAVYRLCLNEEKKRVFEKVSLQMHYFTEMIPIAFVLGFYVTIVVQRWWSQFENIPWMDPLCVFVSANVWGNDEEGRMIRRQIVRHVNLGCAMALSLLSPAVKKKYATTNHLVEAGFMTRHEKKIIDNIRSKTHHSVFWLPFVWASCLVVKARKEGRIRDDFAVKTITDEINRYRGLCGTLLNYEWISIPLVYTQVVTIAVWGFFLGTLMGRQFLDPKMNYPLHTLDYVVPVFTYMQFIFYLGWFKVAETLVNPFGDDDDDFEINFVIERNLQVSYIIVDEMHNSTPSLTKDIYWDEVFPDRISSPFSQQESKSDLQNRLEMDLDEELFPCFPRQDSSTLTSEDLIEENSFYDNTQRSVTPKGDTEIYDPILEERANLTTFSAINLYSSADIVRL